MGLDAGFARFLRRVFWFALVLLTSPLIFVYTLAMKKLKNWRMTAELEKILGKTEYDIQRNRNFSRSISSPNKLKGYLASL
ncbi:hypothetical protein COT68_03540 [bacterium (Candidatus Torokbacteria) CG09_land_8_20_14_0_10_42_11]|nr:MAG: hypothetical protein COT68_03540 [bacterium (Candidatus Torokbacteria) CG09_land_8_20_14_0_10_42_11]